MEFGQTETAVVFPVTEQPITRCLSIPQPNWPNEICYDLARKCRRGLLDEDLIIDWASGIPLRRIFESSHPCCQRIKNHWG